jgi:hypothetical protein
MPPRRTLRNPDPYLLDYLTDEFIAAVVRAGDAYREPGYAPTVVWNPEPGTYGVMLPKKETYLTGRETHFLFDMHTSPVGSLSIISYGGDPELAASVVAQAAEETGSVVWWEGEDVSFQDGFVSVDRAWDACVYVPSWFPDRARFAAACYRPTTKKQNKDYISRVMTENAFPGVPRKYRKQIGTIVQEAYAANDLGTYMQAKELAALVAG